MVRISSEMRYLCSLVGEELLHWPKVSVRSMFGMRAFYRGGTIFALLPEKRGMDSPTAIAYKLPAGKNKREGKKWELFELAGAHEVGAALAMLQKAYQNAVRK